MGSGPERAPRAEGAGRPCGWQALSSWLADRNAAELGSDLSRGGWARAHRQLWHWKPEAERPTGP